MSADTVRGFAPHLTELLERFGVWDLLFDPSTVQQCPAPSWTPVWLLGQQSSWVVLHGLVSRTVELRAPALAPIALAAALVGLTLGARLARGATLEQRLWSRSFIWFGLMNLTAIPCHVLLYPRHDSPAYVLSRALDVGCTGAACVAAIIAAALAPHRSPRLAAQARAPVRLSDTLGWLVVVLALLGNWKQVPWTNEVLYGGLLASCVMPVATRTLRVTQDPRRPHRSLRSRRGVALAYASLGLGLLSVPLDPWLCRVVGPHVNCVLVFFAGCMGTYMGLYRHLTS